MDGPDGQARHRDSKASNRAIAYHTSRCIPGEFAHSAHLQASTRRPLGCAGSKVTVAQAIRISFLRRSISELYWVSVSWPFSEQRAQAQLHGYSVYGYICKRAGERPSSVLQGRAQPAAEIEPRRSSNAPGRRFTRLSDGSLESLPPAHAVPSNIARLRPQCRHLFLAQHRRTIICITYASCFQWM